MKRFKFRLQTLLDQRKAKEDRLLGELAEVRREESAETARLACLCDAVESGCEGLAEAHRKSATAVELFRRDEHVKALRDDVRLQELTLAAVRERVETKRVELVEAMKERKVLESLRDKQEHEYVLACARAEQKALDEMSSLRYARGM